MTNRPKTVAFMDSLSLSSFQSKNLATGLYQGDATSLGEFTSPNYQKYFTRYLSYFIVHISQLEKRMKIQTLEEVKSDTEAMCGFCSKAFQRNQSGISETNWKTHDTMQPIHRQNSKTQSPPKREVFTRFFYFLYIWKHAKTMDMHQISCDFLPRAA